MFVLKFWEFMPNWIRADYNKSFCNNKEFLWFGAEKKIYFDLQATLFFF